MVAVLVVMVATLCALVKALVWAGAVADISVEVSVIGVLSDVVIDELGVAANVLAAGEILGAGAKMVTDLEIAVVPESAIALKFRVPVSPSVDVLPDAVVNVLTSTMPVVIIGIVSGVNVDVKEDFFKAAMTALYCAIPSPLR